MKKFIIAAIAALLFSTSATANPHSVVADILQPYREMDGAVFVNVLENPDMIAEVSAKGGEVYDVFKSLKRFETVGLNVPVETLDSIAGTLIGKASMENFYSMDGQPKPEESENLIIQMFEQLPPLFDYIEAFVLKDGEFYTDFVYLIHSQESAMIAYVQGRLIEEQLKFAIPEVNMEYTITSCSD